jgi:hypothetical protein
VLRTKVVSAPPPLPLTRLSPYFNEAMGIVEAEFERRIELLVPSKPPTPLLTLVVVPPPVPVPAETARLAVERFGN